MTVRGPFEKPHYFMGLNTDTKPTLVSAPSADIGDEFFETDTRVWYKFDGSTWYIKPTSNVLSMYTVTDPAVNAAVTTAIVNSYGGVVITTTTTGNAQTISSPTLTAANKIFTVVNNDTSTNSIVVNGVTIAAGNSQSFIWDGTAWGLTSIGITAIPVPVTQGGTGVATITDHAVMIGSGTGAVTPITVGTNGQVLVGSTGADPVFATITDGEGIDTTLGAGTLTIAVEDASEGNKGILEIATDAEAVAVTATDKAIVPSNLDNVFAAPPALGSTTANTVRSLFDEDTVITTGNLTANQVSGGVINNYAQSDDCAMTWPTIVEGQSCVFRCATTVAKYWRVVAPASMYIWLDGVKGSAAGYVGIASATEGACFQIISVKNSGGTYDLIATTISGTIVAG